MTLPRAAALAVAIAFSLLRAGALGAQTRHHAATHHHAAAADSTHAHERPSMEHDAMPGMRMPGVGHDMAGMYHEHAMTGLYGPYSMSREGSGTSWQPDRAEHHGLHAMRGSWMLMLHGMGDVVYDDQGGARGGTKLYSSNMVMGMARRAAGPGTLGLRAMLSAEPATIGKHGYPLLLQSGETADGRAPLIDRQHPHDLFMELAASYSVASGDRSLFVYGGLPGEPALGPSAYMHRFSGAADPLAPITHHWLDSSHVAFGVLTAGAVWGGAKLEASAFRGREPDQNRWDIESPRLDSHSFRLSLNPAPAWSLQVSRGRLRHPEQLDPTVDVDRTTASAMVAGAGARGEWEAMAAWGRNCERPGPTMDALTVEGALRFHDRHTLFARAERVEKNELFPDASGGPGPVVRVGEVTTGYRFDFARRGHLVAGIGAAGTISFTPSATLVESESPLGVYGLSTSSGIVFTHLELR